MSLLTRPAGHWCKAQTLRLFAANDSQINTHDSIRRVNNIGLRRPIEWEFIVANVPFAIIEVDLLYYYGLSADLRRQMLVNDGT